MKQDHDKSSDKIDEPPTKDNPVEIDDPKQDKSNKIDDPKQQPDKKDKLENINKKNSHRQRRIGSYFRMALRNTHHDDKDKN